ncbi:MAG TPA: pseudouridine synthase [Pyrinomonadaceae bacterium]|nr:pseudouridine synthase [Pyrinomonadaceae bacterium]
MRLQKYLAEAGIASRRASEQIIVEGRVTVNGTVVRELGTKVDPRQDRVTVDGTPVKAKRKIYVALNKPRGVVCSRNDPSGRQTIGELLPAEWRHLYSVGRLDRDSEGLLFLTNDGEFSLRLTHPRYGVAKKYIVTLEGRVEPNVLDKLRVGVFDQGERLKAQKARMISASNKQSVLELELLEGKYREIRRMCDLLGLKVLRLQRVQIGKIKLGELKVGRWRTLTDGEIISLLGQ